MDNLQVALTSGILHCARCGETHMEPLNWHKFGRPVDNYQYWAPCPTTGDPILLYVADEPETSESLTKIARESFSKATGQ